MTSDQPNKGRMTPTEEKALRQDLRLQISRVANTEGLTNDEAWDAIKRELQLFVDDGHISNKLTAPANAGTRGDLFDEETISTPDVVLQEQPTGLVLEAQVSPVRSTCAPVSASNALLELELPQHLAGSGMSVIEAAARGLITLEEEHPDAELLRNAASESANIYGAGVEDQPAMRAIRGRQMSFPYHAEGKRITPSDFNQTSLFHVASNNTPRRHYKNEPMGKIGDKVNITFYGEELRHDDEANFLQLLHIARGKAPFEWIIAANVPFIRESRGSTRVTGMKDTDGIDASLMRMRGAYMVIRNPKRRGKFITVNLIRDLQGSGSLRRIMVDPCIVALLDSYTTMDQDVLLKLRGVSRQIYKYISTTPHIGLYPIKVMSFFELCYGTMESITAHYRAMNPDKDEAYVKKAMGKKVSDFRRKALPAALEELKAEGRIVEGYISKDDKVTIVKCAPD